MENQATPTRKFNPNIFGVLAVVILLVLYIIVAPKIEPYGVVREIKIEPDGCYCLIEWPAYRSRHHQLKYWQPCNGMLIGDTIKSIENDK